MGSICGSCIMHCVDDVLEMSVVHWVRAVGGVREMCMAWLGVCEWVRGFGLGFTNPVGTEGVWSVIWLR